MKVESHSIDYIPEKERYGKARDLFPVWFAANMNITALVTGALLITLGLNLFWSCLSILIGVCLGAFFMASHSAQGARLGIPQMIQSRAQFGVLGAIIPMIFVMFVYLGFSVSNTVLAAQALSGVISMDSTWVIILVSIACFIIALYGYKLIHKTQKWFSWISFVFFFIATILALRIPMPEGQWTADGFQLSTFLVGVSIAATYQLSFGPYVADYSRYLPTRTPASKIFWFTFGGSTVSTLWMMILGAIFTVVIPNYLDNSGGHLANQFGSFSPVMYILIVYGLIAINVFNFYGAFMSTVTTIQPFMKLRFNQMNRLIILSAITIVSIILSILGQGDFVTFFLNFIFFMNYFLIPWTAINLVDYYLIRRGNYDIGDIFKVDGRYGKVRWLAIVAFLLAIALEMPFMNTTFYVGPVVEYLDGIDLAWVVGLIAASLIYYIPMKASIRKSGEMSNIPQFTGNISDNTVEFNETK